MLAALLAAALAAAPVAKATTPPGTSSPRWPLAWWSGWASTCGVRFPFSVVVILVLALMSALPTAAATEGATELALHQYPYVATAERAARLRQNFVKVRPGMTAAEVVSLLGEPEELRPLYEPKVKSPRRIGTTSWYILERRKPSGSVVEKGEKLIRVTFGLDQVVTAVAHWGF